MLDKKWTVTLKDLCRYWRSVAHEAPGLSTEPIWKWLLNEKILNWWTHSSSWRHRLLLQHLLRYQLLLQVNPMSQWLNTPKGGFFMLRQTGWSCCSLTPPALSMIPRIFPDCHLYSISLSLSWCFVFPWPELNHMVIPKCTWGHLSQHMLDLCIKSFSLALTNIGE